MDAGRSEHRAAASCLAPSLRPTKGAVACAGQLPPRVPQTHHIPELQQRRRKWSSVRNFRQEQSENSAWLTVPAAVLTFPPVPSVPLRDKAGFRHQRGLRWPDPVPPPQPCEVQGRLAEETLPSKTLMEISRVPSSSRMVFGPKSLLLLCPGGATETPGPPEAPAVQPSLNATLAQATTLRTPWCHRGREKDDTDRTQP